MCTSNGRLLARAWPSCVVRAQSATRPPNHGHSTYATCTCTLHVLSAAPPQSVRLPSGLSHTHMLHARRAPAARDRSAWRAACCLWRSVNGSGVSSGQAAGRRQCVAAILSMRPEKAIALRDGQCAVGQNAGAANGVAAHQGASHFTDPSVAGTFELPRTSRSHQ